MYNKLLISAGGGIISRSQQSEQAKAATIAIGLGGTGISCLRELKKEVFNKLRPDPSSGDIPTYSHIKFLAVDTDKTSLGDTGAIDTIDSNTEFFDISCPDIISLLNRVTTLKNDPHLTWLSNSINILNASAGAGGVRQIGRLLLMQSSREFERRIEELIESAKRNLPGDAPLNIHIFSGIGGGTGSGTFMDVCYIVQYALKRLGLYGKAQTCGFFFLPDVNIDNVSNAEVKAYIPVNGFAAMKELDYAMSYHMNGGEWNQVYDTFTVQSTDAPVKMAHLITGKTASGATRDNSYEYAMRVVVDYVLEFMTKPYVSDGNAASDGNFTIESHINNIKRITGMVPKKFGACYDYCVLGASNNYLPYKEITTYLASKIFQGFDYLNTTLPTENELMEFVKTYGLRFEDIKGAMRRGVPSVPNYAVDMGTLFDQCQGVESGRIPNILVNMRDKTFAEISGKLETNRRSLIEEVEDTVGDDTRNVASIISRIKSALDFIAKDAAKGPYYATALLHTVQSKDLQNIIDGYIRENKETLGLAEGDLTIRIENMDNKLMAFKNAGRLSRKSKGEEYLGAVHAFYMKEAQIEECRELEIVLARVKKQVEELYSSYYLKLKAVLEELSLTFAANLTALATPVDKNKSYSKPLMTIQDLQASLDDTVKAMRIPDLVNHFITFLIDNDGTWLSQDESKISAAVTNFFLSELNSFTNKTIIDYLKVKFDETDPSRLRKKIYDEIVYPAYNDASPLFWADSIYDISDASKIGYCSVPETSPEIQGAADDLHAADNSIDRRVVFSTGRISIFEFLCGLPLFGYKGVANYHPDYETGRRSLSGGTHLYEKNDLNDKDDGDLPNITPVSAIPQNGRGGALLENSEEYDYALKQNVIVQTVDDDGKSIKSVSLCIFDSNKVDEIVQKIETVSQQGDVVKMNAMLESFKGFELPVVERKALLNDGSKGYQESVIKDHVLESKHLTELVRSQNRVYKKFRDAIDSLETKIKKGSVGAKNISAFASALCAGAISRDATNIFLYTYEKIEYGISEAVELTNITTEPYGQKLPLYSAYTAFCKLSDEDKSEIAANVQQKMITDYSAVAENTEKIKQFVSGETQKMVNVARQNFALEAAEIVEFVKKMNAELSVM